MHKLILSFSVFAGLGFSQMTIPDGTRLRIRLEQTLSSATSEAGQAVEFSVADDVVVNSVTVIPQGSAVTGTITEAAGKRRLGRAGHLDFSVDRVRAADGQNVPLRYTPIKGHGQSNAVRTGLITAGVAAVFWPAAPVFLLMHGKDVVINKGVTYEVFTDESHLMAGFPHTQAASATSESHTSSEESSVTVSSPIPGDEIEIDKRFVGNTPTTIKLASGTHHIAVGQGARMWDRTVQIGSGSSVYIIAQFPMTQQVAAK